MEWIYQKNREKNRSGVVNKFVLLYLRMKNHKTKIYQESEYILIHLLTKQNQIIIAILLPLYF